MEWLGWVATLVFALSYAARDPATLRRVQAFAALLWIGYGLAVGARPVVAANAIVAGLAILSARRKPANGGASYS